MSTTQGTSALEYRTAELGAGRGARRGGGPGLHRIAVLTALATFPLIFMGGLVTSHQAGMSVPDWPNSYGYNMFLFPPRLWIGGILYEHTHRLMGTVVGMLSIVLCLWAWLYEPRRWVRWLCTGVLGGVIFQGVLGGLRVVMVNVDLAVVHACVAQAFFCLGAFTAVVTSRWWKQVAPRAKTAASRVMVGLGWVCVGAIYCQLILGAVMRHDKAGLAIPDYPLHYGHVLPQTDAVSLKQINDYRAVQLNLDPVTAEQVWLHFSHRTWAYVVTLLVLALVGHVVYHHRADRKLLVPASILGVLIAGQVTLGILTVLWKKPADVASLHVAVGALTLLTTFVLTVRAARLYGGGAGVAIEEKLERPGATSSPAASLNTNPLPV